MELKSLKKAPLIIWATVLCSFCHSECRAKNLYHRVDAEPHKCNCWRECNAILRVGWYIMYCVHIWVYIHNNNILHTVKDGRNAASVELIWQIFNVVFSQKCFFLFVWKCDDFWGWKSYLYYRFSHKYLVPALTLLIQILGNHKRN